jgi:hypothetical protein
MDRREATAEGAQAQSMKGEQPNARRNFLFIPEFIQQVSTRQMLDFFWAVKTSLLHHTSDLADTLT